MALYAYVKAKPKRRVYKKRVFSVTVMFLGFALISYVAYPIVAFEVTSQFKYTDGNIITAVNETVPPAIAARPQSAPDISFTSPEIDYTKIENWFPQQPQASVSTTGRIYFLSIPKLRIVDAVVKIAGESLDKSLIHYGGTGLPGDYGNAVIFGHSILPQLYDPTNYKSIFSLLPDLDKGDEVFIKFDGITYRYVVFEMHVTKPDDVTVLEQRYDSSYISLVTCVPPGTYWKRLVVKAQLQRY